MCRELPSSGDIAPLPSTDIEESRKLPDNRKTVTTGVKQKKRKRINGNVARNVKKKPSKSTSPDSPSDINSQVASDDEQSVNLKVPKRRCGVTRYTVAKQQIDDALKETVRLRRVITLLESEIDEKNKEITKLRKNDMWQQSEIKKLSILIDYRKHQLRKDSLPSRDVPASNNWSPSPNDCENGNNVAVNRRRRNSTKAVSARKPPVSHCNSIINCDAPRSHPASCVSLWFCYRLWCPKVSSRQSTGTIPQRPSVSSSCSHRVFHSARCRTWAQQAWCGCRYIHLPRLRGTADHWADQ